MNPIDHRDSEFAALRERLSQLSKASLRINESLDLDCVLQGVLDSARDLTGALYGVIVLLDDSGQVQRFLTSGMSPDQARALDGRPEGQVLFEKLGGLPGAVRGGDFQRYLRDLGSPKIELPMPVNSPLPFLFSPITYLGKSVGSIYLGDKEGGREFSSEDEELIVMFAVQSGLVIANARLFDDERRARTDLEALVNTAPVGVLVFDAKAGAPVYINRESLGMAAKLSAPGVPAEEVLGMLTFRRADGIEYSVRDLSLEAALKTSETVRAEEMVLSVSEGPKISVLVNATPIRLDNGEIQSVVITVQDLTPIEELEKVRAEFLGMVSHELRAPLAAIKGSASTLVDESATLDPAEMLQFSRIIVDQTERMRKLIAELLDVAQIETGRLSLSPEPAEIAILADEAKNVLSTAGITHHVRLELPPDLPLVAADRRRTVQVLVNLLSNAAAHSPEASTIRVNAVVKNIHVEISVVDRGQGISKDRLQSLFRKFSPSAAGSHNAGLGLAICKGVVEAHGGRIWAESKGVGQGARFTFTLPVAGSLPPGGRGAILHGVQSLPASRQSRQRILVVDDDPHMLRYVREILTKAGFALSVTADPNEVPQLMAEKKPQLVLLDLLLPGTDGIELMNSVRGLAKVPVIFLSAYGQDEVIARAFESGAADYVVKPFSPTELLARIRSAFSRHGALFSFETPAEPYRHRDLVVDYARRHVTVSGQSVELTATEYRLLVTLAANAGRILAHDQLLLLVWGREKSNDTRLLRSVIKRLRQKIGDSADRPVYVFTKRSVGYWMPENEPE